MSQRVFHRRQFAAVMSAAALSSLTLAQSSPQSQVSIRGKLRQSGQPALVNSGRAIVLLGDDPTMKVLSDERIAGSDFEVLGRWLDQTGANPRFEIERIHTRSMFVHQNGKRLMVTYWCDVCYIRTYSPGICWCCQKNTDLELLESVKD